MPSRESARFRGNRCTILQNVMDDAKSPDLAEACVSQGTLGHPFTYMKHGVLRDYVCDLPENILSVICSEPQSPTVHYSNGCCVYHRTNIVQGFALNSAFEKLLKTTNKLYVGVCRKCLKLLDKNFQCFYITDSCVDILSALCNEKSGEVVTSGGGNITVWRFRQRAKIIVPHRTITAGIHWNEQVSLLYLEESYRDQRLFAAVHNGVKVFSYESGNLLMESTDMHSQPITALLFFHPMNYVITGSKDGTVKVWDPSWQLRCTFVGHHAQITAIAPYSYGPMLLSASWDGTVRVWNLLTSDQVDILEFDFPVEGLVCKRATYTILCYTKRQLIGMKVHQLYRHAATIGREITFLKSAKDSMNTMKILACCADSAVRIVYPREGYTVTTALLPLESHIVSLGYTSQTEMLYLLDTSGVVHVYNIMTNPSTLKATCSVGKGKLTCLCLYEAVPDEEDKAEALADDKWLKVILEAKQLKRFGHKVEEQEKYITFLLGGTDTGHIVVLDLQTLEVRFSVKGQDDCITMVICNPKKQQVISAGTGNLIQVWRIYPHVQEVLSLQCSFNITSSPSLMINLTERLVFACNNTDLATYTIDVYSLAQNTCFTGHPACSHTDVITGLDSFSKLNIIASCGRDRTVRIWTEDNNLIRVLEMDCVPRGLAFCTFQGDIVIELHGHLQMISNTTYFTDSLLKQFMSLHIVDPVVQSCKGFSIDISTLDPKDHQRLLTSGTPIQKDDSGILLKIESEESLKAEQDRAAALQLINSRNEELKKIKNGSVSCKKKRAPTTAGDKERVWRELLQILHPELSKPTITAPDIDDFHPDSIAQQSTSDQSTLEHKGPQLRFFPPLSAFNPPYPIAPDGYIPNSSILQKLRKCEADQLLAQQWKPIVLSPKQLNEIAENALQTNEEEALPVVSTGLRDKLQAMLAAEDEAPKPATPSPPPTPPSPRPTRIIVPHKKIEKLVAPKKAKTPTPPRTPTPPPSPPRLPTPPPPSPPLPDFIAQFVGKPWFEKLFPSDSRGSFHTMTVKLFSSAVLSCFNKATDYMQKAEICLSLSKLFKEKDPPDGSTVCYSMIAQLLGPPPICYDSPGERQFVTQALKLIFMTNLLDTTVAELLLFYFAHGDSDLQQLITNYLLRKGLNDPFVYFPTVIEQNLSTTSQGGARLLSACKEWFQEWIKQLSSTKQSKHTSISQPANAKVRGTKKAPLSQPKQVAPESSEKQTIEVINYLIAAEHENELSRQKPPTPPPPQPPSPELQDVLRNAIIALPKIHQPHSLVRLGETHKSCCHPERETTYSLICQLPHLSVQQGRGQANACWLSLAVKRHNINPFLTEEEKTCEKNGNSFSSIVRYFVPGSSYVKDIPL